MLTHLFTPKQCAHCKLCCNFHRSSAWETPSLDNSLVSELQASHVPLEQREDGSYTFHLEFDSTDPSEAANCPMLDTCSGCTLPRAQRPFECRIWPLRIMRLKDGRFALGLYLNCPALIPQVKDRLIADALNHLLPTILQYAGEHPSIVRPADPAYDIIWEE